MLAAAGEPISTSSISEQPPDQRPRSGGASWSSGAAVELQPPLWHLDAAGASGTHKQNRGGSCAVQRVSAAPAPVLCPRPGPPGEGVRRGTAQGEASARLPRLIGTQSRPPKKTAITSSAAGASGAAQPPAAAPGMARTMSWRSAWSRTRPATRASRRAWCAALTYPFACHDFRC